MSRTPTDILFAAAVLAIAVSQVLILRSTRRGMALGGRRAAPLLEWLYAVVPAVALVVVLAWTWRTMHPGAARAAALTRVPSTFS